jgi:hypothetical protein
MEDFVDKTRAVHRDDLWSSVCRELFVGARDVKRRSNVLPIGVLQLGD